jgi:asparagine synthase (glutamine-hydrolysing)
VSKICGVCHFDSRPVSREDAARVHADLRGPSFAPREHRDPGLLMGWAAGPAAPERPGLFQAPDGSVCLWDGRLDNGKDLLRQTGLPSDSLDSAIVLGLYKKKGVSGLGDVVGDWSVCIWDAGRREILLASDYAGIRPLYYHCTADNLYWSSSLADLARWTAISDLNDLYAAGFLLRGSAPGQTPYAGIVPAPAGHAVLIAQDKIARRAFWTLPVHREIRYPNESRYEEELLELFREGVQARMSPDTPTCAELSGGLDSSSVVCMADRLRKQRAGCMQALNTFSYTHDNCPDERYFLEVERNCDLVANHLDLREFPAFAAGLAGATPAWWEPRFRELSRRMSAMGSGVFLTGQFGDLIMANTTDDTGQVTEWLARGRFWKAAREAYAWARSMQAPIYPILWRSIREACSSWIPPVSPLASVGRIRGSMEDSLSEGLRARIASDERDRLAGGAWRDAPPGRRRRFRAVGEVLQSRNLQAPEALQHISYAHPFAHRPLVEFMLAIPAHVVCRPGQPRRLMRRAFSGLLPQLVLGRMSKAAYESTYLQPLMPLAAEMLKHPGEIQVVERGYLDRTSLTGRLARFAQGLDCNQTQLRLAIVFEFWLRNRTATRRIPSASASEAAVS